MLKKIVVFIFFSVCFLFPNIIFARENQVNLYLFWSKTCPHCAREKEFLQKISPNYPNLLVHYYEISDPQSNFILRTVGEKFKIETSGVPITIVGKGYFVGYYNDEITGKTITNLYEKYVEKGDPDLVGAIIRELEGVKNTPTPILEQLTDTPILTSTITETVTPIQADDLVEGNSIDKSIQIPKNINIPLLGSINIKDLSLPAMAILLGALDGFNPCAMWTLLFLISLLLGMKDKKRRWILGSVFIFSSAFVYLLFMAAWLNLILFIGFIIWVRVLIGLVALSGGGYNLREYIVNKDSGCKVTSDEKRQKVFDRLKNITQEKKFLLALGGIVLLAFAVNLVELICSAGLPVVFTQVLALSNLTRFQYYLYMILYIFVFMLDDLFVFLTAMVTLEVTGISTKYSRYSHLIGGILMIIIGLLLIFRPELLMFG